MRRASRARWRAFVADLGRVVETLPPEMSQDQVREWWTREHEMISVFSETVKLIHYWCRYGISPI